MRVYARIRNLCPCRLLVIDRGMRSHMRSGAGRMECMNFYEWMLARYAGKDTPRGDLAADMKHAGDFPDTCDRDIILSYLDGKFACDEACGIQARLSGLPTYGCWMIR